MEEKKTPAKALTTQEEINQNDINTNIAARDLGIIEHNIRIFREQAEKKHLELHNLTIDREKLEKRLTKEKAREVVDPHLAANTDDECKAAEAQNAVQ